MKPLGQAAGVQAEVMAAIEAQLVALPLMLLVPPTTTSHNKRQQAFSALLFWIFKFPTTLVKALNKPSKLVSEVPLLFIVKFPPTLASDAKELVASLNVLLRLRVRWPPTLDKAPALMAPAVRVKVALPPTAVRELRSTVAVMALAAVLLMLRLPPTLVSERRLMLVTPVPLL